MAEAPSLFWFRNDLRLSDNPALTASVARGNPVIAVFIWSPDEEGTWKPGAASRWWLHQSLVQLSADLRKRGSKLIIRRGPFIESIKDLIKSTGADGVFWNRRYEPAFVKSDRQISQLLQRSKIRAESHQGNLLFEPEEILTKQQRPYHVFPPFWKACLSRKPVTPLLAPERWSSPTRWPKSLAIESLELEPKIDWAARFRDVWRPGGRGAHERLRRFRENALAAYVRGRDRPGAEGTSRLSPHLHFGEISPRQVWSGLSTDLGKARSSERTLATARSKFLAEL